MSMGIDWDEVERKRKRKERIQNVLVFSILFLPFLGIGILGEISMREENEKHHCQVEVYPGSEYISLVSANKRGENRKILFRSKEITEVMSEKDKLCPERVTR